MSLPTQEKVVDFVHNARQKVTEAVEKVKMPTPLRLRDLIRQVRKQTSYLDRLFLTSLGTRWEGGRGQVLRSFFLEF